MVERIGNITGYKSKQKESDPVREKLRVKLVSSFRKEKLKRKIKKNLDVISAEIPVSKAIEYLFDNDGNPPKNAPAESIVKLQSKLSAQIDWLIALSVVFDKKLKSLDAERYQKDKLEREMTEEREKQLRREEYNEVVDRGNKRTHLRKSLREDIQSDYRARMLKKYLKEDAMDATVFGIEQVASGIRLLFAEYVDDPYFSDMSVESQYELIYNQLAWLGVMEAEVRSKLAIVMEMVDATLSFMEIES